MRNRNPELEGFFKPGQTIKLSRKELVSGNGEEFDNSEERAMLKGPKIYKSNQILQD